MAVAEHRHHELAVAAEAARSAALDAAQALARFAALVGR
jgi:hypothetical protein